MKKDAQLSRFDRDFFDRFYNCPETRASNPQDFRRLAEFVLSYLKYLEVPLRDVVDLGCGLGWWKEVLHRIDPKIRYTGVDVSSYLCQKYGWQQASVAEFRSRRKYDLVICQDVLPYLAAAQIPAALSNIARLCRGAAYIQVMTKEDWEGEICDPRRTDETMHRFEAGWYRSLIGDHFTNCGGGVFVPKKGSTVLWELEHF